MIRTERDDIQFRISRRRLLQGLIASVGISCSSPDSGSINQSKEPLEEENTNLARGFLEAVIEGNIQNMYVRSHPEIQAQMSLQTFENEIKETVQKFRICSGSKLKKKSYSEVEGNKRVIFEVDPWCRGNIIGRPAVIKTMQVDLKLTSNGKYAPRHFLGALEPIN